MNSILTSPYLLLALGGFMSMYLYGYMHRTFYKKKEWAEKYPWLYFLVYLTVWVLSFGANLLEFPPLNLATTIGGYLVSLYICYEVTNLRGLGYYVFYLVGIMVMEAVLSLTVGGLAYDEGLTTHYESITPEISLLMNLCELLLVLAICRYGNKDRDSRFDKITRLFIVMPLLSVTIVVADMFMLASGMVTDFNQGQFFRTLLLLLIINIAIFIILEKYTNLMKKDMDLVREQERLKSDADILDVAAKSMKEKLTTAEKLMQQDRVMRHDRRHFEALLMSLLEEGKVEDAKQCLQERLQMEPKATERYCDNTTINAAISHYVSWAERENIRLNITANIPKELTVDDMELAITISNLLENAIHACQKLPESERFISFSAKYKKQLLLEIENACRGTVPLDEEGCPFTNEEGHGVGTRSVLAFANKTESEVYYIAKEGRFAVRMIIG